MSLLTGSEWRTSYRHEDGNLIEWFYNPALTCAVQYDRTTATSPPMCRRWRRAGLTRSSPTTARMRLIVGCTPQQPEQDAIGEGYDWRARLEAHLLAADLTPLDDAAGRGLEMLACRVAQGHLDVKAALILSEGVPGLRCGAGNVVDSLRRRIHQ